MKITHHEPHNTARRRVTKCEQIKYPIVKANACSDKDEDEDGQSLLDEEYTD